MCDSAQDQLEDFNINKSFTSHKLKMETPQPIEISAKECEVSDTEFNPVRNKFGKRTPKCTLCKNHGRTVSIKGHKPYCPFANCECSNCILTIKRRKIMANQVALRRFMELDESRKDANVHDSSDRIEILGIKPEGYVSSEEEHMSAPRDKPKITLDQTSFSSDMPVLLQEFDFFKHKILDMNEELSRSGFTTRDVVFNSIYSLLSSNDFNVENTFDYIDKVSKEVKGSFTRKDS